MANLPDAGDSPLFWPVHRLLAAYRSGALSPVEVTNEVLARIDMFNPALNAYLTRMDEMARKQAKQAEQAYRKGEASPLCGVPISIKDTFAVAGVRTTYGSYFFQDNVSDADSGLIARLRASGAVFTGKTNTAEFGQSATTDNRLGPDAGNAWDETRTPGGSSGGAASSVAAGLASVGLGADGGGSIRIPAAFTGLFGFKPTHGLCADENGCVAMTEFVCPGPLARTVDDGRRFMEVIAESRFERRSVAKGLRIAWSAAPEGRPVDPAVASVIEGALAKISDMGHEIIDAAPPIDDWKTIFGPLVLSVEHQERGDLLERGAENLTDYERETLQAGRLIGPEEVATAKADLDVYRLRIDEFFDEYDVIVTPTTATTAFTHGERPTVVDGREVSELWGAFPFTPQYNVAGTPGASLPCGLSDGLPVGLQVIAKRTNDHFLFDLSADLEEVLAFDNSAMRQKWLAPEMRSEAS